MSIINLPTKFSKSSIKDFKDPFKKLIGKNVYIYGSYGVGKTHLAIALAKEQMYANYKIVDGKKGRMHEESFNEDELHYESFIFIEVNRLFLELRNSYNTNNELEIFNIYALADYLILDDLGAEKISEWVLSTFDMIINERYANERTTIVTSNYSFKDIAEHYGMRVASRLHEMCEIIELKGENRRK